MQFTYEQQHYIDERYQLLPVDAEDEVIHIGDKMVFDDHEFIVAGIGLVEGTGVEVVYYTTDGGLCNGHLASDCRRYHNPTVEEVLREFAIACEDTGNAGPEVQRLAGEYAKRLQLREDR